VNSDPFRRKSSEEILEEISALRRGRLKIFLGAGSGTGKTYQMLREGRDLQSQGIKVAVCGVNLIEHPATADQIGSLELISACDPSDTSDPSDPSDSNATGDLDVEAILARKPAVLLVDDLAHVNQRTSRQGTWPGATTRPDTTRLDDIHLLLDRGINVMTTLNIYNLEELREHVKKLTGIEPLHTIPLAALAAAHEIKLVDVEPEVVLARLQEERRAAKLLHPTVESSHLDQENLSILRELALRLVAEDVNDKLEAYRKSHGMNDSSSATERVLVAVKYNSNGTLLIRRGQQVANRLNGELHLVTVNDDRHKYSSAELAFKEAVSRLAKKIDANIGELLLSENGSVSDLICQYAALHGITRIVIGQSRRTRWEEVTRGSLVNELLTKAKHVDLMIVADRRSAHGERLLSYRQRSRNAKFYQNVADVDVSQVFTHMARGRFKIYIGAAPGVGKTYMMLQEAHELRSRHIDVVGGLIETHNRAGTQEQIGDLEMVERKTVSFRGAAFSEMDLESILRRNPEVALVDELAHSNIEGCTHRKRYEDVEELLEAGISVIATLNVQHLESLNDTIFQLTGVKVRETVPDYILRMAHEVVLIDVPPESLQQRMREGKIYALDKAEQALSNFFRQGNLIALRELALREVADHIDDRLEANDERSALRGPWRRMEVVYVCVNLKAKADRLIRRGFRTADRLKAKLYVSIVQDAAEWTAAEQQRVQQLSDLTHRLGGAFVQLRAKGLRDIPRVLLADMEEKLATQVVLGHSSRKRRELIRRGHTLQNLLRSIYTMDVVVIAED